MCSNIKTLHNFEPTATEEEIRASAIKFVRKLSRFNKPSKANEAAFNHAVDEVTRVATECSTRSSPARHHVIAKSKPPKPACVLRYGSEESWLCEATESLDCSTLIH